MELPFELTDRWLSYEMMHIAWEKRGREVPYCFWKVVRHTGKNRQFWPELSVVGLQLKFEITDGFEIMHKTWCSPEEPPHPHPPHPPLPHDCLSKSSI